MPILGTLASQFSGKPFSSFESIATATVGSGGSSSVSFTSIPSTYTHLQVRGIAMNTGSAAFINWKFNSDSTGSNYYNHRLYASGSVVGSYGQAGDSNGMFLTTAYPSYFGVIVVDILDYTNTNKYKVFRNLAGWDGNGSGEVNFTSGLWQSTSAITRIDLALSSFAEYSQFALYGIKN